MNGRGYDESWHEINIEELVRFLFKEKLIVYTKKPTETFRLTPKGVFLHKFMNCYSPKTGIKDKDSTEFHKFLSEHYDWSWLWDSVKRDGIKK